jgi:hypothetical protein
VWPQEAYPSGSSGMAGQLRISRVAIQALAAALGAVAVPAPPATLSSGLAGRSDLSAAPAMVVVDPEVPDARGMSAVPAPEHRALDFLSTILVDAVDGPARPSPAPRPVRNSNDRRENRKPSNGHPSWHQ